MEVAAAWVGGCVEVSDMTEILHRPAVASRERHHLAADAFLYAAMIFLAVMLVTEGIAYLLAGGEMGTWTPPVWLEAVSTLGIPLAVIGGPLLAWRVHEHHLGWRDLGAAVVGAVVGGAVFGIAFFVLVAFTRVIASPVPEEEGPWGVVIIAALAVLAFLVKPVVVAIRDLAGAKEHVRRHGLRVGIVGLGVVAVIASVFVGGESAELGLFLLLPAVPAAFAVTAMDWRVQHHQTKAASQRD